MTERRRLTSKIKDHLAQRTDWVMMALKHNVLKTIRFEDIVEHMRRQIQEAGKRQYFLVRRDHAERSAQSKLTARFVENQEHRRAGMFEVFD